MYYRVKYKCHSCGHTNYTRKKKNNCAPVRCVDCGSYQTHRVNYWRVKK